MKNLITTDNILSYTDTYTPIQDLDLNYNSQIITPNKESFIFTESKETARYLSESLEKIYPGKVIRYDGDSSAAEKKQVINNFDANAPRKENEYRILIATEVLAEGVNLHRSNVVINYDIPWNPTRLMQRVGRVNRIDTEFEKIYTFNFFTHHSF